MTIDQQIRKARELLAPPLHARAECQRDISLALGRVEDGTAVARSFRVAGSTKGKAGVKRYCAALQRLRNAYNSLDPAIKPWFSLAETVSVAGNATVIDREIARTESFLDRPSVPPRRDASRHKIAVAAAYDLTFDPKNAIADGFLRLAALPTFPLDRLSRYEYRLWRQARQIVFTLELFRRRKPEQRRMNFPFSFRRPKS